MNQRMGYMRILTFTEVDPLKIPKKDFNDDVARSLYYYHKKKVSIEFPSPVNDSSYILRSNGYIGYIPLDENFSLQILPKIAIQNVFRMLEYAYRLKSFEFLKGPLKVESIEDLFERLVNVLAKRVLERNRKGLFRGYLRRKERLPFLRGRLMTVPTIMSILRGSTFLECEYQEHTADLEDNRILAWTLFELRHFKFHNEDIQRNVNKAFREIVNKVSLEQIEPRDLINRFYHRLNQDYKPMHGLCRFFLENCGPGLETGEYEFIPFVIHMPNLFELFVAEWIRQHLPLELDLEIQYNAFIDEEKSFMFKIDLIIVDAVTGVALCVLDTKYKRKPNPDGSDVQQIVAYAVSVGADKAFLIYPSPITRNIKFLVGQRIEVRSLVFDISQDPDLAGKKFLDMLLKNIK